MSTFNSVLNGIVSSIIFIVLFLFLDMGLIFSIGGTIAVSFGLLFILQEKTKEEVKAIDYQSALEEGYTKINKIKKLYTNIKQDSMITITAKVIVVIEKILKDLKEDPSDIKQAKQFLSYYLDSTIKILEKYLELSAHSSLDPKIKESLMKVENMMDTLRNAFEVQLTRLLENEVMDLDTELSLLGQTIKMEGLEK